MGRASLVIEKDELENCINRLERENTYRTFGELCEAVANSDWGLSVKNSKGEVRGISAPKVYAVIREYGIKCVTQPGKRGRVSGGGEKVNRSEKLAGKKEMKVFSAALMKSMEYDKIPDGYKKLAEQAINGSFKAAIKLNCISCCGFSGEHRSCDGGLGGVCPCPLYPANLLLFPNRKKED